MDCCRRGCHDQIIAQIQISDKRTSNRIDDLEKANERRMKAQDESHQSRWKDFAEFRESFDKKIQEVVTKNIKRAVEEAEIIKTHPAELDRMKQHSAVQKGHRAGTNAGNKMCFAKLSGFPSSWEESDIRNEDLKDLIGSPVSIEVWKRRGG